MVENIETKEQKHYRRDDSDQPLFRGVSLKHIIGAVWREALKPSAKRRLEGLKMDAVLSFLVPKRRGGSKYASEDAHEGVCVSVRELTQVFQRWTKG